MKGPTEGRDGETTAEGGDAVLRVVPHRALLPVSRYAVYGFAQPLATAGHVDNVWADRYRARDRRWGVGESRYA